MTSDLEYQSFLRALNAPLQLDASPQDLADRVIELEDTIRRLWSALGTRDTIGMAKGILMAREHCNSDQAFDILRRGSQRVNRRVADIAAEIVASNGTRPAPAIEEPSEPRPGLTGSTAVMSGRHFRCSTPVAPRDRLDTHTEG